MKKLLFAMMVTCAFTLSALGQTSAFTYQGKLNDGAAPANGQYDFVFDLYDTDVSTTPVAIAQTVENAQVTNGIFTVELSFDFTPFTSISGNWLEIGVRPGASTGGYTTLNPRQKINSSPYAMQSAFSVFSNFATNATTAANANAVGGTPAAQIIKEGDSRLADARSPLPGSLSYIQANPVGPQPSTNLNIDGSGRMSGNLNVGGTVSGNGSGLTNIAGTLPWQVTTASEQGSSNRGYLVNGAAAVQVTLPAAPQTGDVVRVSSANPLGWRISQNDGQSIIGADLSVIGSAWTPRDAVRQWSAVASSADGSKLVAAVSNGQLYTSGDAGRTWTPRDSVRFWTSVASSADGTRLVASEFGSGVYTSTDSGATWSLRVSGIGNIVGVSSSADGSVLAAVAQNGQIHVSTNSGQNWTARESARFWQTVAVSGNGSVIVAGVGSGNLFVSTDGGANFAARAGVEFWRGTAASFDGTRLAAASESGFISVSTDSGATWVQRGPNRQWLSVASSADGLSLAAAANNDRVYVSADGGTTWLQRESVRAWRSVASSADGGKIAAAPSGGPIYLSSAGGPTGTTTIGVSGFLQGGQYGAVELQFIGAGRFMILSRQGTPRGY